MDLLKNIFKGDKIVWIIFMLLCLISIIEVFSAASTLSYKSGNYWAPFTQHTVFLIVGTVIVVVVHRMQYRWFQKIPQILYPASVVMLGYLFFRGILGDEDIRVNEASRFLPILGIQFQPSELAKMAVILLVASLLSKKGNDDESDKKTFWKILTRTALVAGLIAPENMSTALLLIAVVYLMMIIGQISAKRLLALTGIAAGTGVLFVTLLLVTPAKTLSDTPGLHRFTTWKNRIETFFDQEKIPASQFDIDKDAQIAHANIAIATSNVIGKLPGNSVQRDFLSQAFSDFIFAIIIEELGLAGGIFVVCLYLWLLVRVGRIVKKCDRTFPAYLILGITLLIVSQAMLNMMVAVGLFPVTGQPLPFISRGGTSILVNCTYLGMILSVSRYANKLAEEQSAENQLQAAIDTPTKNQYLEELLPNQDMPFEPEQDN